MDLPRSNPDLSHSLSACCVAVRAADRSIGAGLLSMLQVVSFIDHVLQSVHPVQAEAAGLIHQALKDEPVRGPRKGLLEEVTDTVKLGRNIRGRRLVSLSRHSSSVQRTP